MKTETLTNHPPQITIATDNPPLVAPIYQTVKFTFDELGEAQRHGRGEREGFAYSRIDNPTTHQLELTLAALQRRDRCVLTSSGVAAIALTMQALCKQGDHLVVFAEGYAPTRNVARRVLSRFGVNFSVLSVEDHLAIERTLRTTPTRLMLFESPTNPILKVADVARLCGIAKANDCLAVMDNTMAGLHAHGDYPVDIFVHSLTKYANGHGDVTAGAIIGNEALMKIIRSEVLTMGVALDPHAAFLVQRGLKTYGLRFERSCQNALAIARMLESHPAVDRVYYPGLESHPGYSLAMSQTGNGGGVITFEAKGDEARANQIVDKLKLFKLASSLGSTESLVMPPSMIQARDLVGDQKNWAGISMQAIRLSIGVEHVDDLITDLQQALE
jgi:cystathionine beta-lyase/cystathionine gamma-synthase